MLVSSALQSTAPEGSQSAASEAKLQEDLNRFLTLLVTQLQNQDPLDPLKANEFTSQLVQFASVEQQIYQNSNLEKLVAHEENAQIATLVNYIGKAAEVSGNALPLAEGRAMGTYTLAESAHSTVITISNASGDIVYAQPGETGAGTHGFRWDGRDAGGNPLPDGTYTMEVRAQHVDETPIETETTVIGRVTGAAADGGEALLYLGDVAVPVDGIVSIKGADWLDTPAGS